jgi:hypothetical protein
MMPEFIVEDIDRIPNFCEDLYQHCRDDDRASISLGEADRATGSLKVWLRSARRLRRVEGMIRKLENNLLSVLSRLARRDFSLVPVACAADPRERAVNWLAAAAISRQNWNQTEPNVMPSRPIGTRVTIALRSASLEGLTTNRLRRKVLS